MPRYGEAQWAPRSASVASGPRGERSVQLKTLNGDVAKAVGRGEGQARALSDLLVRDTPVAGHGFNMPFLTNLTKHAVYKSDKQYRFIPEIAKVTVPPSWPGPTTAASQQVWDLYIIPDMFAQHATGEMTGDQAIAWAEKEMQEIYAGRKRRP
jgi:hypothetical protein